jgi:hypothetical protein
MLSMIAAAAVAAAAPQPVAWPAPAEVPRGPAVVRDGRDIGFFTAGALADKCNAAESSSLSYCFAYITAVHDTMRAYEIWLGQREFCVPGANAQGDLRRAFLTYLTAYPSNRTGQAASVIVVALKETYPCVDASVAKLAPAPKPKAK